MYGAVPPLPLCLYAVYMASFTQRQAYKDPWLRILFRRLCNWTGPCKSVLYSRNIVYFVFHRISIQQFT